jgi:hypothetical protein
VEGIGLGLSAYCVDEGGDDPMPGDIIARKGPIARRFADDLARLLGPEYFVVPYSGYW